jgi:hypothetical protein
MIFPRLERVAKTKSLDAFAAAQSFGLDNDSSHDILQVSPAKCTDHLRNRCAYVSTRVMTWRSRSFHRNSLAVISITTRGTSSPSSRYPLVTIIP